VKKFDRFINRPLYAISLLLGLFLIYRTSLLILHAFPFNSDEAIVGLMAKHILSGERPLFFYGQVYMGSLDAFLVALAFKIFSESVIVIRLVQSVLFFLSVLTIYLFAIVAFDDRKIAFFSALLLIFSPVNLILYSTVSLGGYGEALLIGTLSLFISAKVINHFEVSERVRKEHILYLFLLGILTGLGLWVNAISLTFCIPSILIIGIYLIKHRNFQIKIVEVVISVTGYLVGFALGSYFWWSSFLTSKNFSLLSELTGSAVSVEQNGYIQQLGQHLLSFFLFGPTVMFGLRPPWDIKIILPFMAPVIILFWLIVMINFFRKWNNLSKRYQFFFSGLIGIGLFQFLGYVFTSFGVDPSGRYFLPFYIPLSIIAAYGLVSIQPRGIVRILFSFVLLFNLLGVLTLALKPPFLTTQFYAPAQVDQRSMSDLIEFLETNGEFSGYSNYWVSYPLIFLSDERIISIPVLPYHNDLRYSPRDNRIPDYNTFVDEQERAFYITTNNPPLDQLLNQKLIQNHILFRYEEIGDFHIYFDLSNKISPTELGLYGSYK